MLISRKIDEVRYFINIRTGAIVFTSPGIDLTRRLFSSSDRHGSF